MLVFEQAKYPVIMPAPRQPEVFSQLAFQYKACFFQQAPGGDVALRYRCGQTADPALLKREITQRA
ncbi:hypothetical protein D3C78_1078400 [compost metagenome]